MKAVFDPVQLKHDPQFFLVRGQVASSTEQPERAQRLLKGLADAGVSVSGAQDFGAGPRAAIHTPEYLDFLQCAWQQWQALPGTPSAEVIPNVHPQRYSATYPAHVVGRAGWHQADTACPIGEHTFEAACAAANTALTAASLVMDGERAAYALCRPPGHHAFADMAGGFCFLNNTAIAAQHMLSRYDRVAILDVDVHHGNGTQGIFYARRDVLTISIHCDPVAYYPYVWGHASERGAGPGEGYNRNLPLPADSGDDVFVQAVGQAAKLIQQFGADALVIALGLDASEHDPLRGLAVTTAGFGRIGKAISGLALPTLYVQEGGYLSDVLGQNLTAFLNGARVTE